MLHKIIHPLSTDTIFIRQSLKPNHVGATYLGFKALAAIQSSDDIVPLMLLRFTVLTTTSTVSIYFQGTGGVTKCSVESVWARVSITNIRPWTPSTLYLVSIANLSAPEGYGTKQVIYVQREIQRTIRGSLELTSSPECIFVSKFASKSASVRCSSMKQDYR